MGDRKIHLHYRTDGPNAPSADALLHGEIAMGYEKDNEKLYIKNSQNEIVNFVSEKKMQQEIEDAIANVPSLNDNELSDDELTEIFG